MMKSLLPVAVTLLWLLSPGIDSAKRRRKTIRGSKCAYTIMVNEVSDNHCPNMVQNFQQNIQSRPDEQVKMLNMKMNDLEMRLFKEIVKNRELNTSLTRHEIMLKKAEQLFRGYHANFTNLFRSIMYMEQKLQRQREVSRNLDSKLSSIMLDVVEVNNVLSKKASGDISNLATKQVKVESASKIRSCAITADTPMFKDCLDVLDRGYLDSGVYYILPTYSSCPIPVWCDMDTLPGGWLLFQKRINGKESFNRDWNDYKYGFGDVVTEFWLGNDNLFLLTNQEHYELRIDLWDFQGNRVYAQYANFKIDGERDNYRLHISNYSGSAQDSMLKHDGMAFSTPDEDNDGWHEYHCAQEWEGGWWFNNCWFGLLNGPYYNNSRVQHRGIAWNEWKREQLRRAEMKIRPIKNTIDL